VHGVFHRHHIYLSPCIKQKTLKNANIVTNMATGCQKIQQLIKLAVHTKSFIIMKHDNKEIQQTVKEETKRLTASNMDRSQI